MDLSLRRVDSFIRNIAPPEEGVTFERGGGASVTDARASAIEAGTSNGEANAS